MKEIEIINSKTDQTGHQITIKELYDKLKPLIDKGIDGKIVAYGWYLGDNIIYDEYLKVLFFNVCNNFIEETIEKGKKIKNGKLKKKKNGLFHF